MDSAGSVCLSELSVYVFVAIVIKEEVMKLRGAWRSWRGKSVDLMIKNTVLRYEV